MMLGAPYTSAGYEVVKFEPHLHSVHSDGRSSVAAMFEACKRAGYDAVALTDHNTVSGLAEAAEAAAQLDLTFVPGVEVTTFSGHAVALGITFVPEWRDLETRGMDALATDVHRAGGVLNVAHPADRGSPLCSGCAWDWPVQPAAIDGWEIFNGSRGHTGVPLALWRGLLRRGGGIAPLAGGDVHSTAAASAPRAATFVYVEQRTAEGVLDALRRRRVSVSRGMRLDFWAEHADGRIALAGARLRGSEWTPRVSVAEAVVRQIPFGNGDRCLYAELLDADEELVAVSAPIWISTSQDGVTIV
jgi:hypothetical protein